MTDQTDSGDDAATTPSSSPDPQITPEPEGGGAGPEQRSAALAELRRQVLGIVPTPQPPKEVAELLWYQQLCELGIISPKEFRRVKRRLLGDVGGRAVSDQAGPAPADQTDKNKGEG